MKKFRTLILLSFISQPVWTPLLTAAPYAEENEQKLEEAAQALAYRARQVISLSLDADEKSPDANLQKATRLARQIQVNALDIATLLEDAAEPDQVLQKLSDTETLVLQIDAAKRQLQSSHSQERELLDELNSVRRTYYYLKQLLTGVAGRNAR